MTGFLIFTIGFLAQAKAPLRFRATTDQGREVVAQLPAEVAAKLPMGRLTPEQGEAILTVALIDPDTKKPGGAMFGKYERKAEELIFTPRFPLDAGQTYRATLRGPGKVASLDFAVPKAAPKAPPRVVKIYPAADVLPANNLRFYIYFDRPMRGGKEIFKQFAIVDDKGKEVHDPWLLDEIWDDDNNCLILYIHPGRIKWGVFLRQLLGPVLVEKRSYSLVVRGELTDIDGNKIGKDYVKKFRTTAEDRVRVNLSDWKLIPAFAGTSERFFVEMPKSFDHRNLEKYLSVTDANGHRVEGKVEVRADGKSWALLPDANWQKGTYHLEVNGDLEDVAGNTPLRPFDLDLNAPKLPPQKLRLPFQCR